VTLDAGHKSSNLGRLSSHQRGINCAKAEILLKNLGKGSMKHVRCEMMLSYPSQYKFKIWSCKGTAGGFEPTDLTLVCRTCWIYARLNIFGTQSVHFF